MVHRTLCRAMAALVIIGIAISFVQASPAPVQMQPPPPHQGEPYSPDSSPVEVELPESSSSPGPPQPERGQRPLPPSAAGVVTMGDAEMLGVGPLGLGGGPFEVSYFFDGMEGGSAGWAATGLWHIADASSSYPNAYNGAASWWYGREATGNYDTGAATSGYIQTGPIAIPGSAMAAWLRFWSWEYTEDFGTQWDTRKVYTSTNGTTWMLAWQSADSSAQWYEVLVDLSSSVGQNVYLRFEFDTVDSSHNGYRGWYVDDVAVGYKHIQLSPTSQTGYDLPGVTVGYPWWPPGQMWIQNNTGITTVFTITATSVFTPNFPTNTVSLSPSDIWSFSGNVEIPDAAPLSSYDDATLLFTSVASPTLTNTQTVRTWAGWVHHQSHQIIDDGSGNSQGDGDGKIDPGETVEVVPTLKNDLDRTAYDVNAWMGDSWGLWWYDTWESYGDIIVGGTANPFGRYEFETPSTLLPCTVITFSMNIMARAGWWTDSFTETVPCALTLRPDSAGAGDPGETVVYNLMLDNGTGAADSFDTSVSGAIWATTVVPDPTAVVPSGNSTPVTVSVTISPTAQEGDSDTATVQAIGVTNPAFSDTAIVTTSVLCQARRVYTGSQSGTGSYWNYYSYGGPIARVYVSATTNYTGDLQLEGWDGSSWAVLYSDQLSGTREVRLAYAPAVYDEIDINIDDGGTSAGWAYDYRFETCYDPVQIQPQPAGAAAPPGSQVVGILRVENYTGVDTPFDLAASGASWTTVVMPTCTITVPNGSSTSFTVTVDISSTASVGDFDGVTLTATSVASPTLGDSGRFTTTAVSKGWYQAYDEDYPGIGWPDHEAYLDSVNSLEEWRLTDDRDNQWDVAVSAYMRDRVPYAWARSYNNPYGYWVNEVLFGARDPGGTQVISPTRVTDHFTATDNVYDYSPVLAVVPTEGNIALAWTHQDRVSDTDPWRWNVYYAVYDEDGNVVQPPSALTSNTYDAIQDFDPAIASYRDGHIAIAWEHLVAAGGVSSVYYAVLNGDGNVTTPPKELTPNAGEFDDFDPRLAQLPDNNVLAVWEGELYSTGATEAAFAILGSLGGVVQGETALTDYGVVDIGEDAYALDAVALPSGEVVVVWEMDVGNQIHYAVLSSTIPAYTTVVSPTVLTNAMSTDNRDVSLTADEGGRVVLTWRDGTTSDYIYYALVSGDGAVVVPPVIYRTTRNNNISTHWKGYGNGGMSAQPLYALYLATVLRDYGP